MRIHPRQSNTNGGFATLVLVLIMGMMAAWLTANALALHHLKQEIKWMERKHQRVHEAAVPPPNINAPAGEVAGQEDPKHDDGKDLHD